MGTTTGCDRSNRRPRRLIPWLAGLGILATLGAAASLLFLEVASHLGDEAPQPSIAPEVAGGAALVALLVCLPRLSARVRAWGWSLSGVVAYVTVSNSDWLADGSFIASPVLPLLAALSGGALLMAGVLLADSRACAGSAASRGRVGAPMKRAHIRNMAAVGIADLLHRPGAGPGLVALFSAGSMRARAVTGAAASAG